MLGMGVNVVDGTPSSVIAGLSSQLRPRPVSAA